MFISSADVLSVAKRGKGTSTRISHNSIKQSTKQVTLRWFFSSWFSVHIYEDTVLTGCTVRIEIQSAWETLAMLSMFSESFDLIPPEDSWITGKLCLRVTCSRATYCRWTASRSPVRGCHPALPCRSTFPHRHLESTKCTTWGCVYLQPQRISC